jgi:hypothetical protein
MLYDLTLTDADIGKTIGPPGGGFLVDLKQTQSGPSELAQATPAGVWKTMYLQLRGSLDHRDLYCAIPSQNFMNWSGATKYLIVDHSLDYHGDLKILCVPKGAMFEIALSDVELSQREKDERANARQRKELEAAVAKLQRKADDLAPVEPAPPMLIERPRERVTVRERRR